MAFAKRKNITLCKNYTEVTRRIHCTCSEKSKCSEKSDHDECSERNEWWWAQSMFKCKKVTQSKIDPCSEFDLMQSMWHMQWIGHANWVYCWMDQICCGDTFLYWLVDFQHHLCQLAAFTDYIKFAVWVPFCADEWTLTTIYVNRPILLCEIKLAIWWTFCTDELVPTTIQVNWLCLLHLLHDSIIIIVHLFILIDGSPHLPT